VSVLAEAGSVEPAGPDGSPADDVRRPSLGADRTIGDLRTLLVAFGALLLSIVYVPGMMAAPVTARLPIVLVGAAPGVVALVGLLRRRDRAALWLGGLLAWSLASALLSTVPALSLLPSLGTDDGWLIFAASACWWASGRRLGGGGEHAVIVALAAGVVANVGLSFSQALSDGRGTELLDFTYGRSMGFYGNPVYLGGFLAGGLALLATATVRSTRSAWWIGYGLVALVAAGINLSGSRVALVGGILVTAVGLIRTDLRRSLGVLAAVAFGLAASWTLVPNSGASRVAGDQASSGLVPRIETWKVGGEALLDRPVLGWGPGRWMEATAPGTTLRQSTTERAESVYTHAHNLVAEQAVTTGVVGLLLLLGFVWAASRHARGPCLWFAAGVAITWALEPTHLGTTPLVFLALGVAVRAAPADERNDRPTPATSRGEALATSLLVAVALAASVPVVAADLALRRSLDTSGPSEELAGRRSASRWLPYDPELSDHVTTGYARVALIEGDEASGPEAVAQAERTHDLEPTNHLWLARLAQYDGTWGPGSEEERLARSDERLRQALELQPWSPVTLTYLYQNAVVRNDDRDITTWRRRLCQLDRCPNAPSAEAGGDGESGPPPSGSGGD
jgi:O-antigen ligase